MDMTPSAIDLGAILSIVALVYSQMKEKARAAEEMGKLKQQVRSLETRANTYDARFDVLDDKIERLLAGVTRLETLLEASRPPSKF